MHPLKHIALAVATVTLLGNATLASAGESEPAALLQARQEGSISTAFALNRHLSAFDIKVVVERGTAHLSGKVENPVERELAERIAQDVAGISDVDNQLQLDPSVSTEVDARNGLAQRYEDATLVATIKSRLLWSSITEGQEVEVSSDNGVVTLKGRAQSPEAKELAGSLATNTEGVASVNNLISLSAADSIAARTQPQTLAASEPMNDAWVTSKVKSSLVYSRNLAGQDIKVDTKEGLVTLNGIVANFAEKELAVEIARNIRGVKGVNADALKIMARTTG